MKLFIYCGGWLKRRYMYFDTENYLADSIFAKNNVRVYYGVEWINDKDKYRIVECKIRRKDKEKFEKSFDEIVRKMILNGHTDYEEHCQYMIKHILED